MLSLCKTYQEVLMKTTHKIVKDLLEHPNALLLMQEAQAILSQEAQKRIDFYNTITEQEKAEFINGEIIFHSPVKLKHNKVSKYILKLLDNYVDEHNLGYIGIEKVLIALTRNDYEPDICFFGNEKSENFQPNQMRFPAPDLVVEVLSKSTEFRDRRIKFEDYEAHKVSEYWLIDTESESVEQYILVDEKYELKLKSSDSMIESKSIDGLRVPIPAFFDSDLNMKAVQEIMK
ncbi:MAG: Uma2 family endonuclease [Arenicella sp.]